MHWHEQQRQKNSTFKLLNKNSISISGPMKNLYYYTWLMLYCHNIWEHWLANSSKSEVRFCICVITLHFLPLIFQCKRSFSIHWFPFEAFVSFNANNDIRFDVYKTPCEIFTRSIDWAFTRSKITFHHFFGIKLFFI